ncbi:MAG TPA: hypothetical protein VGR00_00960 [Thermoanaerobaculia bacterium]|jgi:hypothetical protein|nr:hypothetical protein [Thermoanaerobaculia bacterium]
MIRQPLRSLSGVVAAAAFLAAPVLAQAPTPKDPKSPLPGHVDGRGPTGPVELKIVSPKPDEVVPFPAAAAGQPAPKGAEVKVSFEIKNYEIFQDPATQTGQHIHIILDNMPYVAHYDATKAWVFKNVPKGTHTIRAFPSRPWHESIKEPGAFAMVTFHVGEKDGKNTPLAGTPLLTYSRPKGKYPKAMVQKLMLDFYVTNCVVAEESVPNSCRVRYKLDDKPEVTLTKWEPVWWDGLSVGKHEYVIGLTRGGKIIDAETGGPGFNLAKGLFEIEEPAAPAAAGAPASPATANPAAPATASPQPKHEH